MPHLNNLSFHALIYHRCILKKHSYIVTNLHISKINPHEISNSIFLTENKILGCSVRYLDKFKPKKVLKIEFILLIFSNLFLIHSIRYFINTCVNYLIFDLVKSTVYITKLTSLHFNFKSKLFKTSFPGYVPLVISASPTEFNYVLI